MVSKKKYRIKNGEKHYLKDGNGLTCYLGGQIVELYDHQARSIRDKLLPLEETAAEIETREEDLLKAGPIYQVRHKGGAFYDVINTKTGLPMNEVGLKKDDAEERAAELNED